MDHYTHERDHEDLDGPVEPMGPLDPPPYRKRPLWIHETLQDVGKHISPKGTFRESKKPIQYQNYVVAINSIIHSEPQ